LRGPFYGFGMGMIPVPSLLGWFVGHPDFFGGASQPCFGDAHGADLVIVGMGFLELAQMAAFQHLGATTRFLEQAHYLKAVAGSFQDHEILGGDILVGPVLQPADGHLVEGFFDDRAGRRGAAQDGRRETVGMTIQADDPAFLFFFYDFVIFHTRDNFAQEGRRTGQAITCTQVCGAVPYVGAFRRCSIHKNGD
jgi:hypothetical protein